MNIEWPHDIDCPACLDSGECNCWVKESKAHVKRLEEKNGELRRRLWEYELAASDARIRDEK